MNDQPSNQSAPSLLDPCTCMRDGAPCPVCVQWNRHLAWFESRPEPEREEQE